MEFRKRLNDKALDEDERRPPSAESDTGAWMFGPRSRGTGSIHSDIWTGTAADLARRGLLAVYPVTGWWKENKSRDRSERVSIRSWRGAGGGGRDSPGMPGLRL
jgi:hypothetical protein